MSNYVVTREAGPGWANGGISAQPGVDEHSAFMNSLANEGFLLFAGPLARSETDRVRVLLIVNAENEEEVKRRLAEDPWFATGQLATVSVEWWRLLVGSERLATTQAAQPRPAPA
jgi:uncharacterized protein YciI